MNDLISRQAAIDLLEMYPFTEYGDYEEAREAINRLPSAQPEEIALHESCTDCPLYDKDRHICPRFNKVIPKTLRELRPARPNRKNGKWEMRPDPFGFLEEIPVCSECGCTTELRKTWNFCPNCGADMRGEQNERIGQMDGNAKEL